MQIRWIRWQLSMVAIAALWAACAAPPAAASERWAADDVRSDDVTNGLQGFLEERPTLQSNMGSLGAAGLRPDPRLAASRSDAPPPLAERMLVHRGAVTVDVPRPEDAVATFLARVEQWGGYLSRQQDTSVTVRLPAEHFDAAFAALEAMGRVLRSQREASDVTEEFLDIGIRLDNARKARDRLLELLAKAEKVEDMLAIEKELTRLTGEIESMEGRRKFLADQVAMATLTGTFVGDGDGPRPPQRRPNRFDWIRAIGADRVLEGF